MATVSTEENEQVAYRLRSNPGGNRPFVEEVKGHPLVIKVRGQEFNAFAFRCPNQERWVCTDRRTGLAFALGCVSLRHATDMTIKRILREGVRNVHEYLAAQPDADKRPDAIRLIYGRVLEN